METSSSVAAFDSAPARASAYHEVCTRAQDEWRLNRRAITAEAGGFFESAWRQADLPMWAI